ncbi:MAG: TSUP family transporter [Planctomycetota bacterium]
MNVLAWSLAPGGSTHAAAFFLLGGAAAVVISIAKAGFGGSIGILSFPLMVYACGEDAILAAGVMLPLLIVCDYVAIVPWRGKWNLRAVGLLLPGMAVGVALGAAALWGFKQLGQAEGHKDLANACLTFSVGVIALLFVAIQALSAIRSRPFKFRPVLWQGTCIGTVAGLTSTLAHAAGPVVSMYMLPQGMSKGRFVSSTVLYYWIGNQLKLVPYLALGILSADTLGPSLALLPGVVVGAALGLFLHGRVAQRSFTWIVYALLAIAGARFVVTGATELWF